MFGYQDISIEFLTSNMALVLLAGLALTVLAVILYRRTTPPVPLYSRIVLTTLRLIAVAALFTALLEPVIGYVREYERIPNGRLLIDSSQSMDRQESGLSRAARLDSLLATESFKTLQSQTRLDRSFFGGNLVESPEQVDRERTSIGEAVYRANQQEIERPSDFWLLFSDGRSNFGRDIAAVVSAVTVPVFTIDMAGKGGKFDVGIEEASFNPVMFVGKSTEISVKLAWDNADQSDLAIKLFEQNRIVAEESIQLDQKDGLAEITLKYIPTEPGQKILRLAVETADVEESVANNERSLSVKVLKSRQLVLLVSENPDLETGFLRRYLEKSERFEVDLIAVGDKSANLKGQFPSRQIDLNRYDLVILQDPDPARLTASREIIRSYLSDRGGGIWVLMGDNFAHSTPAPWFDELLPFSHSSPANLRQSDFIGEPAEDQLFHPSVRLADNQAAIRQTWAELPPFESLVLCTEIATEGVILVSAANARGSLPAIGFRRHGPGKLLACAASPFWKWGFVNRGYGGDGHQYDQFVDGTVNWLTVREDFDPVRLRPEKEVFTRGETVIFKGAAYDVGFRPIPGVSGVVQVQREADGEVTETDLLQIGEGLYEARFERLPPGNYQYRGDLEKEGRLLKHAEGDLVIESYALEEYDVSGDPGNLMTLARQTGGDYLRYDEFDKIVQKVPTARLTVNATDEFVLWNKSWLLLVFILALSLEWLIRKMNQMI